MKKPHFDASLCAFETEEFILRQEKLFYIEVRNYLLKKFIISALIILLILSALIAVVFYNIGYDNHVLTKDNSPIVYITSSGTKYHKEKCIYIRDKDNITETTINNAKNSGYTPCSKCKPDKLLN